MNPLDYRVPGRAESRVFRHRILVRVGISILAVVVAVVAGVVITFLVISRQLDENLRKADTYIVGERRVLAKDPRFQNVELEHFTGAGGSVLVDGGVASQADLSALQRTITQSAPPVPVRYYVEVLATTRSTSVPAQGH